MNYYNYKGENTLTIDFEILPSRPNIVSVQVESWKLVISEQLKVDEHDTQDKVFLKLISKEKAEKIANIRQGELIFVVDGEIYKLQVSVDIPENQVFLTYSVPYEIPNDVIVQSLAEYGTIGRVQYFSIKDCETQSLTAKSSVLQGGEKIHLVISD